MSQDTLLSCKGFDLESQATPTSSDFFGIKPAHICVQKLYYPFHQSGLAHPWPSGKQYVSAAHPIYPDL